MVNAVGVGSATIWAIVGTFSNSVAVTVSTYTNQAVLMHRYSFSDDPNTATTVADSVPGNSPTWDGTLNGSATLNGSQLVLDGAYGFVQFPAGIITNMDAVSVETWASFGSIPNWAVLFAFGDTTGSTGFNYLTCQPHTGAGTVQTGIKNATTEENPNFTPVLDNYTNVYIAAVFHPEAGYCSIYTNGVLAAIDTSINIIMSEVTATGDPYNYLGQSLWSADPYLPAYINEFRIYSGPLSAAQISADARWDPISSWAPALIPRSRSRGPGRTWFSPGPRVRRWSPCCLRPRWVPTTRLDARRDSPDGGGWKLSSLPVGDQRHAVFPVATITEPAFNGGDARRLRHDVAGTI